MQPKPKKDLSNALKSVTQLGSFGLTVGVAIWIGYELGSYMDKKLGTAPWCMLVLVLLFIIGAFIKFVQEIQTVDTNKSKKGDVNHS